MDSARKVIVRRCPKKVNAAAYQACIPTPNVCLCHKKRPPYTCTLPPLHPSGNSEWSIEVHQVQVHSISTRWGIATHRKINEEVVRQEESPIV